MPAPKFLNHPLYHLLRDGKIADFNAKKAAGGIVDFSHCDFRNTDLRGLEANELDFRGCYFHRADLRGVDFRGANLEGASMNEARISGTYFPLELSPEEISLSVAQGIRMRYKPS